MKTRSGQSLCGKQSSGQSLCGKESLGQSLFELLVALAITVMIVTGIIKVITISFANSTFAKNQAAATRFGQEIFEWLRSERDKNWDAFATRSDVSWCLPAVSWPQQPGPCASDNTIPGTIFLRQANFSTVGNGIQVLVRVSWLDAKGEHSSRIDSVFTNWKGGQ